MGRSRQLGPDTPSVENRITPLNALTVLCVLSSSTRAHVPVHHRFELEIRDEPALLDSAVALGASHVIELATGQPVLDALPAKAVAALSHLRVHHDVQAYGAGDVLRRHLQQFE